MWGDGSVVIWGDDNFVVAGCVVGWDGGGEVVVVIDGGHGGFAAAEGSCGGVF